MPITSAKNAPLDPMLASQQLIGETPNQDQETEELKKKRAQQAQLQASMAATNPLTAVAPASATLLG